MTEIRRSDGDVMAKGVVRAGCALEPAYACVCLAAAVAGGFICGRRYIPVWILLVFNSYTDVRTRQIYCMPTRICIAVDVIAVIVSGTTGKDCISTMLCATSVILLSVVFHMYAQGDAEVFIMLIVAAVMRGQPAVGYTINIVWLSGIIFCIMLLIQNIVLAIHGAVNGSKFSFIRSGPMVPAIAAAFLISCLQWKISFTAMS